MEPQAVQQTTRTGSDAAPGPFLALALCEHWHATGACKFGEDCRFSHSTTLTRLTSHHAHPLGPDSASKRKKFFCDVCGTKSKKRWRCTVGCDFDLCVACFRSASPEPEPESTQSTLHPEQKLDYPAIEVVEASTANKGQDPYRMPCLLEKWLQSSVGLLKQQVADALASGAVTVGDSGEICTVRDMLIMPDQQVLLGGRILPCPADVQRRTWAIHKPRMMETSMTRVDVPGDLLARMNRRSCLSTWLDELAAEPSAESTTLGDTQSGMNPLRLFPIGRLDKNTSGLLLVTNDGELSYALCSPGQSTKIYHAQTRKEPRRELLDRLLDGVVLQDGPAKALSCQVVGDRPVFHEGKQVALEWTVAVALDCGRNRIVRRMFAAVGLPINHLTRVQVRARSLLIIHQSAETYRFSVLFAQVGPLSLDELGIPEPNDSVELTVRQLEQLWRSCGGKERVCKHKRKALELMLTEAPSGACSQEQEEVGDAVVVGVMERATPRLTPGTRLQLARWLQTPASSSD